MPIVEIEGQFKLMCINKHDAMVRSDEVLLTLMQDRTSGVLLTRFTCTVCHYCELYEGRR